MIVDSSALLAVFRKEPEAKRISEAILGPEECWISSGNLFESAMVAEGRQGDVAAAEFDQLVSELELRILPFTAGQVSLAREAFRKYGKGRHPARLNFGACMAYALAKERGESLLFKGDDFSKTDIETAPY